MRYFTSNGHYICRHRTRSATNTSHHKTSEKLNQRIIHIINIKIETAL